MESNKSSNEMVATNQGKVFQRGIRIENPFTFKVGQVFTGFGIGCGVGIGVGRPVNLGAIPMIGQVMSATRGATDAFSGVSRHVNSALRKLGANNIEAGIGCGVGFGYGFGVGLAVKPWVLHQIQSSLVQAMTKLTTKFGMTPNLPIDQVALPGSFQSGMSMTSKPSNQNAMGSTVPTATKIPESTSQILPGYGNVRGNSTDDKFVSEDNLGNAAFDSRTEKVLNNFLHNPALKEVDSNVNELVGHLHSENRLLQMVLKHQQIIEDLVEDNEKLQRILVEELKVPPNKLKASYSGRSSRSPCIDCFECRRKQRRK